MHYSFILISALLFIVLSLVIRLFVGRRGGYRRNWSGLQVFSSYRQNIICTMLENFALFIATACMIVGMILLLIYIVH